MKVEHGKIGALVLTEELKLQGMCTGPLIVEAGGTLYLYGMCNGALEVKPGGTAYLHGTCNGTVTNAGGKLEVFGTIKGGLFEQSGVTEVAPGAVVS